MTAISTVARRTGRILAALAVAAAAAGTAPAFAGQPDIASSSALRHEIERRFDVLPLQNGIALRPKTARADVQSIELTGDTIAVNGAPVTGGELRQKLGADADAVIRLSYLDVASRRTLFGRGETPAGVRPVPPAPASPSVAPEAPGEPTPPAPPPRPLFTRHADARIRFGGNVTVEPDEVVNDSVVVIGGSAEVDGEVNGDVVVIGGTATLGPHADVSKDVTVIGGTLTRDPGARVGGKVNEVGVGAVDFSDWRGRFPTRQLFWWDRGWRSSIGAMATFARFVVLSVLVCLVLLVGREPVQRIAARASAEPVKAGLIGLLAQILFIPLLVLTVVVLVVTIVGIPLLALLPFALLGLAIVCLVGFAAVVYDVGRLVGGRVGGDVDNPYVSALTGIAVVLSPVFAARLLGLAGGMLFPITGALLLLGLIVEYAVWTVGFGAVVLMRTSRHPGPVPAIPSAPGAPPPPAPGPGSLQL